jgi:GNAT superfamily N-acetyltransferase
MIREAGIDEVFYVASFMKRFEECTQFVKVDPKHSERVYKRLINEQRGAMLVMTDETGDINKMVGGLGCVKGEDLHFPRTLAIETFWYVAPEYRGQGMDLIKAFEQWAKNNNCDGCALIHLADSMEDILPKIYKRRGYSLVEQHFVKEF